MDHDRLPPGTIDPDEKAMYFDAPGFREMPSFRSYSAGGIPTLTTPIAYPEEYAIDRYLKHRVRSTFGYWTSADGKEYVLLSPGVDEDFDLSLEAIESAYAEFSEEMLPWLAGYRYDPTNGLASSGDVFVGARHLSVNP